MNLQVEKSDIKNIGHTVFEEDGNTVIICDIRTVNIEEILLRNILKCFGDDYEITSADDYWYETEDGDEDVDIIFTTNLPYKEYNSVYEKKEEDK